MAMLATNGLLAIVTWIPFLVWIQITRKEVTAVETTATLPDYAIFFFALTLCNCFISPLVYFIFHPEFKADGKRIFQRVTKKLCCSVDMNSFTTNNQQNIPGFQLERKHAKHQNVTATESPSANIAESTLTANGIPSISANVAEQNVAS